MSCGERTYTEKLELCAEHGKTPLADYIHDNSVDIAELFLSESDMSGYGRFVTGANAALDEAIHEIESNTDTENSNIEEAEKDVSQRVRDMNHG